jgi:hypothetical protein
MHVEGEDELPCKLSSSLKVMKSAAGSIAQKREGDRGKGDALYFGCKNCLCWNYMRILYLDVGCCVFILLCMLIVHMYSGLRRIMFIDPGSGSWERPGNQASSPRSSSCRTTRPSYSSKYSDRWSRRGGLSQNTRIDINRLAPMTRAAKPPRRRAGGTCILPRVRMSLQRWQATPRTSTPETGSAPEDPRVPSRLIYELALEFSARGKHVAL